MCYVYKITFKIYFTNKENVQRNSSQPMSRQSRQGDVCVAFSSAVDPQLLDNQGSEMLVGMVLPSAPDARACLNGWFEENCMSICYWREPVSLWRQWRMWRGESMLESLFWSKLSICSHRAQLRCGNHSARFPHRRHITQAENLTGFGVPEVSEKFSASLLV